jgi:hypothetical protein
MNARRQRFFSAVDFAESSFSRIEANSRPLICRSFGSVRRAGLLLFFAIATTT